jgi:hypothetical protein
MITIRNVELKDLMNVIKKHPAYTVVYSKNSGILHLYDYNHKDNRTFDSYKDFMERKESDIYG